MVDGLVRQARDPSIAAGIRMAAFSELVERFRDMTLASALRETGDFHLAEDAAQEAFVSAYLELDRLRTPAAFGGWLREIARRKARRLMQRRGRVVANDMDKAVEPIHWQADEPRAGVQRALAALPAHERLPLALFYWGGYAHRHIAALLEITPTAAKQRVARGRKRLAERATDMDAMDEAKLKAIQVGDRVRFADELKEMIATIEPRQVFRARDLADLQDAAPLVEAIQAWEKRLVGADAAALQSRTATLRQRLTEALERGRLEEEVLFEFLPEVFGAAAWCCRRAGEPLGAEALLTSVALHKGQVVAAGAELGSGILPVLYLNALPQKGVHLVAADKQMAATWARRLQPLAGFLGVEVAAGEGAGADIWCAGAADLIFAHLHDRLGERYLRPGEGGRLRRPHFAVLDDIEHLLVEGVNQPFVISGHAPDWDPRFFIEGLPIARGLIKMQQAGAGALYEAQGCNVTLTDLGIQRLAERLPGGEWAADQPAKWARVIKQLIRALATVYEPGREYAVQDGRVYVVNSLGQTQKTRRFSEGLHQALEMKEGVELTPEHEEVARTTYREFFGEYAKLSGIASGVEG